MALTAAGLRLAAKAIINDGDGGVRTAMQQTDEATGRAIYHAFIDNEIHLMRHTAEEPLTCPCYPRERELLGFAKPNLPSSLHDLADEAIAIPDGNILTDGDGNYVGVC